VVDFGGGIKTDDEIRKLFEHGVQQVNLGSIAVKEPQKVIQWIDEFGSDKIILSADVKNNTIAISGWQENSSINIRNFLRDYIENGIEFVTCTDISTDGMLTGPNIELYKTLILSFPQLHLVASGGVGTMDDLQELKRIGVDGVIVGKAIYEGRVKLEELALL
jgi:phosphoribosylformimino-5-aminoimidazole carboxamide ribotide isomerase